MNPDRKPDGVVFYALTLRNASLLPDPELGRVVKAVWRFYETGEMPEDFDVAQTIVFDMFRQNVVDAFEKYSEVCKRNKQNAQRRKNGNESERVATTGIDLLQVSQNMKEKSKINEIEHENKIDCDSKQENEMNPNWSANTNQWLAEFDGGKRNDWDY